MSADTVRFGFGENWRNYAAAAGEAELQAAIDGLAALLPATIKPADCSFLDIGSGSGLHSVAAARLGFKRVFATDYDPNSVATTKAVAARFGAGIEVIQDDILTSAVTEQFDVVYSWGVLHHTGDMKAAMSAATKLVAPGGLFIVALYRRTPLCPMWRIIKRSYCQSPAWAQAALAHAYHWPRYAARVLKGRGGEERGMDLLHDARDWLGGYPYESASPDEVCKMAGMTLLFSKGTRARLGLFGNGCAEYVFRRATA